MGVDSPFTPDAPVPIGRPCRDTEILILKNDSDEAAAANEIGRLMICGSQVSPGYWRRPELTARAFRVKPLKQDFAARMYESGDLAYRDGQGVLYYVGRADSQVKYQGYRIELGDIEAALRRMEWVNEAAAVLLEGESPLLVGAVAASGAEEAVEDRLLDHCSSVLPAYMVFAFPVLPKNSNGKIDRRAIKDTVCRLLDEENGQT